MNYRCKFCLTRAFEDKMNENIISEEVKKSLTKNFYSLMAANGSIKSAPEAASAIFGLIRNTTGDVDPYKEDKQYINRYLLNLYPEFKSEVESSINPFDTALRLAIAGNIIDNVASPDYNIHRTINHVMSADFRIDHSEILYQEINNSNKILYLGDNAGEIVLDKLFIETIGHSNVYFAVRGTPVINDVTMTEANDVKMHDVAKVISNGSDAPSTIIHKTSKEFRELYESADLIISKGQGNLEGLLNEKSKNIFFLFMVKCEVIGNLIEAKKGDFVVMKNTVFQNAVQV